MEPDILERIVDGREKPTNLPFALLKNITEHFSEDRVIGQGGFATVYKTWRDFDGLPPLLEDVPEESTEGNGDDIDKEATESEPEPQARTRGQKAAVSAATTPPARTTRSREASRAEGAEVEKTPTSQKRKSPQSIVEEKFKRLKQTSILDATIKISRSLGEVLKQSSPVGGGLKKMSVSKSKPKVLSKGAAKLADVSSLPLLRELQGRLLPSCSRRHQSSSSREPLPERSRLKRRPTQSLSLARQRKSLRRPPRRRHRRWQHQKRGHRCESEGQRRPRTERRQRLRSKLPWYRLVRKSPSLLEATHPIQHPRTSWSFIGCWATLTSVRWRKPKQRLID